MKTALYRVVIILLSIIALMNPASASTTPYDRIYTTGASNSTDLKDVFEWNETPWLYLKLNVPDGFSAGTDTSWNSPAGGLYETGGNSVTQELWFTLSNWDAVKTTGQWTIDALSNYGSGIDSGSTNFIVTPEPVSCVLFLVGGAALAARRRQKKRQFV